MEAQLVERSTENRKVGGSSPLRGKLNFVAKFLRNFLRKFLR